METILTWLAVTLAGLFVSARVRVNLPVLGPTPVLGIIALAVLVLAVAGLLLAVRAVLREGGVRLRFGTVTA